jgi:hypothetical protein
MPGTVVREARLLYSFTNGTPLIFSRSGALLYERLWTSSFPAAPDSKEHVKSRADERENRKESERKKGGKEIRKKNRRKIKE